MAEESEAQEPRVSASTVRWVLCSIALMYVVQGLACLCQLVGSPKVTGVLALALGGTALAWGRPPSWLALLMVVNLVALLICRRLNIA